MNEFCNNHTCSTGLSGLVPQVLMIQRKDSLGFMDIMRGKYKVNEPAYIRKQIRGMTKLERDNLEKMDFEDMWHLLWGSDAESSERYAHDRIVSRQKLAELRAGIELPSGEKYNLSDLLRQEPVLYDTPEWGFPKGRREPRETDIQCAFRELEEETSITEHEILKVTNVSPLIEQFYGSNGIHYRHSYFLAQYVGERQISFDALNSEMTREIGKLAWKNEEDAFKILRPENKEKHTVLRQVFGLLGKYSPSLKNELYGVLMSENENNTGEQEYVFVTRAKSGGEIQGQMVNPRRFFGAR